MTLAPPDQKSSDNWKTVCEKCQRRLFLWGLWKAFYARGARENEIEATHPGALNMPAMFITDFDGTLLTDDMRIRSPGSGDPGRV